VTDDDCTFVATEDFVKRIRISRERSGLVCTVWRDRRRCVATHEWSDCSKASIGEFWQEMSPGVRRVGEAVKAQREWAGAAGQHFEVDAIRRVTFVLDARCFGHGETLVE
jgi:hypothetical protein